VEEGLAPGDQEDEAGEGEEHGDGGEGEAEGHQDLTPGQQMLGLAHGWRAECLA